MLAPAASAHLLGVIAPSAHTLHLIGIPAAALQDLCYWKKTSFWVTETRQPDAREACRCHAKLCLALIPCLNRRW
jgi:hypothetical protein